jgi:hypothetical protein
VRRPAALRTTSPCERNPVLHCTREASSICVELRKVSGMRARGRSCSRPRSFLSCARFSAHLSCDRNVARESSHPRRNSFWCVRFSALLSCETELHPARESLRENAPILGEKASGARMEQSCREKKFWCAREAIVQEKISRRRVDQSCFEKKVWCARGAIVQGETVLVDAWSDRAGGKGSGARPERSCWEKKLLARTRSDRSLRALR